MIRVPQAELPDPTKALSLSSKAEQVLLVNIMRHYSLESDAQAREKLASIRHTMTEIYMRNGKRRMPVDFTKSFEEKMNLNLSFMLSVKEFCSAYQEGGEGSRALNCQVDDEGFGLTLEEFKYFSEQFDIIDNQYAVIRRGLSREKKQVYDKFMDFGHLVLLRKTYSHSLAKQPYTLVSGNDGLRLEVKECYLRVLNDLINLKTFEELLKGYFRTDELPYEVCLLLALSWYNDLFFYIMLVNEHIRQKG